jgi:hypothetical protein
MSASVSTSTRSAFLSPPFVKNCQEVGTVIWNIKSEQLRKVYWKRNDVEIVVCDTLLNKRGLNKYQPLIKRKWIVLGRRP